MKRSIIYVVISSLLLSLLYFNIYLHIEYDMNLFQYFTKTSELTKEERAWLDAHGRILYVSDSTSPPHRFIDSSDGQFQGLIVDYISALSIEVGHVISIESTDWWSESLEMLASGESDIVDLIPSKERAKVYDFSDPLYRLKENVLFDNEKLKINSIYGLKGKTVAVAKGDYAIDYLKDRVSSINYIFTEDSRNAILLLKAGKADAVVGEEAVLKYLAQEMKIDSRYKTFDEAIIEKDAVLAVKKGETVLLSILNKGIYSLKKKMIIDKVQEKWFGTSMRFNRRETIQMIVLVTLVFISIICMILYLSYAWNKHLIREVDRRTEELQDSNLKLQTTFDGLTRLMIVLDRGHHIINVNDAFCKAVDMDKGDIIGRCARLFQKILYCTGIENTIENSLAAGKPDQQDYKYMGKVFQMSTFPLENNRTGINHLLVMIEDVTQSIISSQQLLHESKMAATGLLAAGVAHEIRNPLGLIRNYCYILKHSLDDEVKVQRAISVIESSVERSSDIIDNLLNFSRMSSNEYEKIRLKPFMNNLTDLQNQILEKKSIRIDVRCPEDFVCCVKPESLKHVIINLISNSIDALPEGGRIKITCRQIDDKMLITHCDNGKGIRSENLQDIFDPFYTTKPIGKGTGLGLYIAYSEIQKHGGNIRVTSKLGKGTCFQIELPLNGENIE